MKKQWVFDPHSGGVKISPYRKARRRKSNLGEHAGTGRFALFFMGDWIIYQ